MTHFMYRAIIILPLVDRAAAQDIWKGLDPVGWADTFTSELSATGELPATHCVCSCALTKADLDVIETLAAAIPKAEINVHLDDDAGIQGDIDTKFDKAQYKVPGNPRAAARISRVKEDPHEKMSSNSLQPIN